MAFRIVEGESVADAIRRIFELTGLHDVFPIYASRADALTGLSAQGRAS